MDIVMKSKVCPAKSWKFQLDDYEQSEYEQIKSAIENENVDWAVVNKIDTSLIGFISFKEKTRITTATGIKREGFKFNSHAVRGKSPATQKRVDILYLRKIGQELYTKNATFKEPKKVKVLDDDQLYDWQLDICSVLEKDPDDRTIHWYWSDTGNVGKSTFQKYLCVKYGAIILGGKSADCKHAIVEYEKTHGDKPEIIVCNIPRSFDPKFISYQAFEEIKDMCFHSGKYEGGMVVGNCPHLIIFANIPPNKDKMSKDRWNIVNLDPEEPEDEVQHTGTPAHQHIDEPPLEQWNNGTKQEEPPLDQWNNGSVDQNIILPMDESDEEEPPPVKQRKYVSSIIR